MIYETYVPEIPANQKTLTHINCLLEIVLQLVAKWPWKFFPSSPLFKV